MVDGAAIGITSNGDLDDFLRPRLILKDVYYRLWSTVLEQMLSEKKLWCRVQGTLGVPRPNLMLGASATPVTPVPSAIVSAMGVATFPCDCVDGKSKDERSSHASN